MSVMDWLLDSDPSIRWQGMRDLTGASDEVLAVERSRVAVEGWGAELLAAQGPGGGWGDGDAPEWVGWTRGWRDTLYTLLLLRDFGIDPDAADVREAVQRVRDGVTWGPEFDDNPFF